MKKNVIRKMNSNNCGDVKIMLSDKVKINSSDEFILKQIIDLDMVDSVYDNKLIIKKHLNEIIKGLRGDNPQIDFSCISRCIRVNLNRIIYFDKNDCAHYVIDIDNLKLFASEKIYRYVLKKMKQLNCISEGSSTVVEFPRNVTKDFKEEEAVVAETISEWEKDPLLKDIKNAIQLFQRSKDEYEKSFFAGQDATKILSRIGEDIDWNSYPCMCQFNKILEEYNLKIIKLTAYYSQIAEGVKLLLKKF